MLSIRILLCVSGGPLSWIPKGITFAFVAFLFSCQRTGLAERAARVPDPLVRVKRHVSVTARGGANTFRLTRTRLLPLECETWKDRTSELLQGPRILGPARDLVNRVRGRTLHNCPTVVPIPLVLSLE